MHIPAPRLKLPGHAESYNPPPEYLPTQDEVCRLARAAVYLFVVNEQMKNGGVLYMHRLKSGRRRTLKTENRISYLKSELIL